MSNLPYPFTTALKIMKPSKIDPKKKSHRDRIKSIMRDPNFIWEEKLDGINLMSIGGRMFSNVNAKGTAFPAEKTAQMAHVANALQEAFPLLILDGEAFVYGKKCNEIVSMINSDPDVSIKKQKERGFVDYWVYDILRDIDGTWLTSLPQRKRRERMEQIFMENFDDEDEFKHLILNPSYEVAGCDVQAKLDEILDSGREGIVLKDKRCAYFPGQRPQWNQVKLKASMEDDVIITGFAPATRLYTGKNISTWNFWEGDDPVTENYAKGLIGSIEISKYNGTVLIPFGTVTGLTDLLRSNMTEFPEAYIGRVIKIKAMEPALSGVGYRHANFVDFHDDKNAIECQVTDIPG